MFLKILAYQLIILENPTASDFLKSYAQVKEYLTTNPHDSSILIKLAKAISDFGNMIAEADSTEAQRYFQEAKKLLEKVSFSTLTDDEVNQFTEITKTLLKR